MLFEKLNFGQPKIRAAFEGKKHWRTFDCNRKDVKIKSRNHFKRFNHGKTKYSNRNTFACLLPLSPFLYSSPCLPLCMCTCSLLHWREKYSEKIITICRAKYKNTSYAIRAHTTHRTEVQMTTVCAFLPKAFFQRCVLSTLNEVVRQ